MDPSNTPFGAAVPGSSVANTTDAQTQALTAALTASTLSIAAKQVISQTQAAAGSATM